MTAQAVPETVVMETANDRLKQSFSSWFWGSMIAATAGLKRSAKSSSLSFQSAVLTAFAITSPSPATIPHSSTCRARMPGALHVPRGLDAPAAVKEFPAADCPWSAEATALLQ